MASRRSLVRFQIFQGDKVNGHAVDFHDLTPRITICKLDAIDSGKNFNAHRRNTHADHASRLFQQFRAKLGHVESEIAEQFFECFSVSIMNGNPNVEIACSSRMTVVADGVSADEHILNLPRV